MKLEVCFVYSLTEPVTTNGVFHWDDSWKSLSTIYFTSSSRCSNSVNLLLSSDDVDGVTYSEYKSQALVTRVLMPGLNVRKLSSASSVRSLFTFTPVSKFFTIKRTGFNFIEYDNSDSCKRL